MEGSRRLQALLNQTRERVDPEALEAFQRAIKAEAAKKKVEGDADDDAHNDKLLAMLRQLMTEG